MEIKKKIWPFAFQSILEGKKKFELRLNDFVVTDGDILILQEYNPEKKVYTGREIRKKVTYVYRFAVDDLPFWPPEEVRKHGLQIISIE